MRITTESNEKNVSVDTSDYFATLVMDGEILTFRTALEMTRWCFERSSNMTEYLLQKAEQIAVIAALAENREEQS